MSYRFTNTAKWEDEWFIGLSRDGKIMWNYLCDNCDIGGFYELSMRKLRFDLEFTDEEIKVCLKGLERGYILSKDKRVIWLINFIRHQKNLPLNRNNMAHRGIFSKIEGYKHKFEMDLIEQLNSQLINNEKEVHSKGLNSPYSNSIGNSIIDNIKNKGIDFENFWSLYNKKVGNKKAVCKKWDALKSATQKRILEMLPEWKKQFSGRTFQPHPETFLNGERWNDEIIKSDDSNTASNKFPNNYDRRFEAKLSTQECQQYHMYLKSQGFKAVKANEGYIADWIKAS